MNSINVNRIKRIIGAVSLSVLFTIILVGCDKQQSREPDTVIYEEKEFVFVEYPENIFYCDYNGSINDDFEEVDETGQNTYRYYQKHLIVRLKMHYNKFIYVYQITDDERME